MNLAISADIGGSHITSVAVDIDTHMILEDTYSHKYVNSAGTLQEVIESWSSTLQNTILKANAHNLLGMSIAMPGPFDYLNGKSLLDGSNGKYGQTYGENIKELLRDKLMLPADFPIRFLNDAVAYGIGEDLAKTDSEYSKMIALTLGTGLGSTFIENSMPVVSGDTVPLNGSLWHLPFRSGNVDDYFSTRGLVSRYQRITGEKVTGIKEIVDMVNHKIDAKKVLADFGLSLAECLEPWMRRFQPDTIVIGGNASRAFSFFGPAMQDYLGNMRIACDIRPTIVFEKAALLGASRLVEPNYYDKIKTLLKHLK